jgi:hypothetical protein
MGPVELFDGRLLWVVSWEHPVTGVIFCLSKTMELTCAFDLGSMRTERPYGVFDVIKPKRRSSQ